MSHVIVESSLYKKRSESYLRNTAIAEIHFNLWVISCRAIFDPIFFFHFFSKFWGSKMKKKSMFR